MTLRVAHTATVLILTAALATRSPGVVVLAFVAVVALLAKGDRL